MRIALCYFGQPRFLDNPLPLQSFRERVFSQGEVDVFTHFWWDDGLTAFSGSPVSTSSYNLYAHPDTLSIIQEQYRPTAFLHEPPKQFAIADHLSEEALVQFRTFTFYSEGLATAGLSQFYSYQKCVELVEQHTAQTGTVYDFVVITRYDALLRRFPVLSDLSRKKVWYTDYYCAGCFTDIVLVTDPCYLDYLKTYRDLEATVLSTTQKSIAPDALRKNCLYLHFNRAHLPLDTLRQTDLYASIVRHKEDKVGES